MGRRTCETMIKIEKVDSNLIELYQELSQSEYKPTDLICSIDHLKWKYLENPNGQSVGVHAYENGELVGRLCVQKKICRYNGLIVASGNLTDLLINKKSRSLGRFLELTTSVFDEYKLGEEEFCIMCPNDVSIGLYKRIYGLRPEYSQRIKILPIYFAGLTDNKVLESGLKKIESGYIRILELLAGKIVSRDLEVEEECERDEYEGLVRQYYCESFVEFSRDWIWHKWRFSERSGVDYIRRYVYEDNRLVGIVVLREVVHNKIKILMIIDLMLEKKNHRAELALLSECLKISIERNLSLIMFIGSSLGRISSTMDRFMLEIPRCLRPFEIEHYAVGLHKDGDSRKWRVTMADYDIF